MTENMRHSLLNIQLTEPGPIGESTPSEHQAYYPYMPFGNGYYSVKNIQKIIDKKQN
jgi:hypothetical protein